jgi:hypothetical protein
MPQEIVGIGAAAVNGLLDQWSCALYIAKRPRSGDFGAALGF